MPTWVTHNSEASESRFKNFDVTYHTHFKTKPFRRSCRFRFWWLYRARTCSVPGQALVTTFIKRPQFCLSERIDIVARSNCVATPNLPLMFFCSDLSLTLVVSGVIFYTLFYQIDHSVSHLCVSFLYFLQCARAPRVFIYSIPAVLDDRTLDVASCMLVVLVMHLGPLQVILFCSLTYILIWIMLFFVMILRGLHSNFIYPCSCCCTIIFFSFSCTIYDYM